MTHIKLKFIHCFMDRHGVARHYFRRRGCQRVPLPGLPGSAEFMEKYRAALEQHAEEQPRQEIGAARTKPGTVAAAVAGYLSSHEFTGLAEWTKRTRRNALERFRQEHGDKPIAHLQQTHVQRLVMAKPTPSRALHFLIMLRELMRWSVKAGLRHDDPTQGIDRPRFKSSGYYTWTEDDITKFESTHPIGSRARLAMALGLYLGQRRGDVIGLGRQHLRKNGGVQFQQQKTGTPLVIPVHPDLQEILDAVPQDQLTFLTTQYGRPFTDTGFTNWFKKECRKAGLPGNANFHGLRKAAARRLAEAGCSANVIASITAHQSPREVSRYTAIADQFRLATPGIQTIPRRKKSEQKSGKPGAQFAKTPNYS